MFKVFLVGCISAGISISFAQTKGGIIKGYAFYSVSIPGAQMVDDQGNPIPPIPVITRFIFIECAGTKNPGIEKVLYNNMPVPAKISKVEGNTVLPGNQFDNSIVQRITAKKNNSLWKIVLQPTDGYKDMEQDCKNIIIKTGINKRACLFKLQKEKEIMSLPRY